MPIAKSLFEVERKRTAHITMPTSSFDGVLAINGQQLVDQCASSIDSDLGNMIRGRVSRPLSSISTFAILPLHKHLQHSVS